MESTENQIGIVHKFSDGDFVSKAKSIAKLNGVTHFICARMTNAPFSSGTIAMGYIIWVPGFWNRLCISYVDCYTMEYGYGFINTN